VYRLEQRALSACVICGVYVAATGTPEGAENWRQNMVAAVQFFLRRQ
jgi:hypothetical protein